MSLSVNSVAPGPKVARPRLCKPSSQGSKTSSRLAPLAGVTAQGATPYTSEWLQVTAGAFLQLTLSITRLTGTLSVMLETVDSPKTDVPRFCGAFPQTTGVSKVKTTVTCDSFVRVIATPGAGAGQVADWTISGQAVLSSAPRRL
jgi:hypothetical protein